MSRSTGPHEFGSGLRRTRGSSNNLEPLLVTIATAMRLLDNSRSTIYRKLKRGVLTSVRDGNRQKITMASIKALAERASARAD